MIGCSKRIRGHHNFCDVFHDLQCAWYFLFSANYLTQVLKICLHFSDWLHRRKRSDRICLRRYLHCTKLTRPERDIRCATDVDTAEIGKTCNSRVRSGWITIQRIRTHNMGMRTSHCQETWSKHSFIISLLCPVDEALKQICPCTKKDNDRT